MRRSALRKRGRSRGRFRLRRRYGRSQLSLPFHPVVRNVLGEERQVEKVFPDGSYNCPFCFSYANVNRGGCENPACSAGTWALAHPEQTRPRFEEQRRQAEERKKEEAWRKERDEFSRNYAEEQQREHATKREEVIQEAHRRGACIRCALEPLPYRPPKYVKHRGACPKERR
jgi:hypothetical protein